MEIRGHHLLCMQLFEGKGYNDTFCEGMRQVIEELKKDGASFTLQCKADVICNKCPNLTAETNCRFGNMDVEGKDKEVMKTLGLSEHEIYSYREVNQLLKSKIDADRFQTICGTCRWYQEKVCTYEKWKNSFTN